MENKKKKTMYVYSPLVQAEIDLEHQITKTLDEISALIGSEKQQEIKKLRHKIQQEKVELLMKKLDELTIIKQNLEK